MSRRHLELSTKSGMSLVDRLESSLVLISSNDLEGDGHGLGRVCCGETGNDSWCDGIVGEHMGDNASREAASMKLGAVFVGLGLSTMAVSDAKDVFLSIANVFRIGISATSTLFGQADKLMQRAELTNVEGTIAFITTNIADYRPRAPQQFGIAEENGEEN